MDLTALLLQTTAEALTWLLPPALLLMTAVFVGVMADRVKHIEDRRTAQAGFRAGLALYAVTLIYQVIDAVNRPAELPQLYQGVDGVLVIASALITILLLLAARAGTGLKLSGLATLFFTFLPLVLTSHYLLNRTGNDVLLSGVFGVAIGIGLFVITSPHELRRLLRSV
jgi:hypothetical protein